MRNKKNPLLGLAVACILVLAIFIGIRFYNNRDDTGKDVTKSEQLYSLKNDYVGNASADIALLNALDISKIAPYTIELETSERPYILRINFSEEPTDYRSVNFDDEMKTKATILLALIDNVDEIHYNNTVSDTSDDTLKLRASDLKAQLGDIKSYNKSLSDFQGLLSKIKALGAEGEWCTAAEACDPISFY